MPRATDETDAAIGAAIKHHRLRAKMSQSTLGEIVDVTYQQIQKYESAMDRVSASRLAKIAQALDVDVSALYGLAWQKPAEQDDPTVSAVMLLLSRMTPAGQHAARDLLQSLEPHFRLPTVTAVAHV